MKIHPELIQKNGLLFIKGQLTIGIIPTVASFIAADLYHLCATEFPELELVLIEDTSDNLLDKLEKGQVDVALLALPYNTKKFHTHILAQDPFNMVMHQDYDVAKGITDFNLLPPASVFLLEREHCLTDHALSACHLSKSECINPFEAASLHTLLSMVERQLGVC